MTIKFLKLLFITLFCLQIANAMDQNIYIQTSNPKNPNTPDITINTNASDCMNTDESQTQVLFNVLSPTGLGDLNYIPWFAVPTDQSDIMWISATPTSSCATGNKDFLASFIIGDPTDDIKLPSIPMYLDSQGSWVPGACLDN